MGTRILTVEDDERIRTAVKLALDGLGPILDADPVDVEVEARAEEVLVVRREQALVELTGASA